MTMHDEPTDSNWRSYLHALPEAEPGPLLWSRLQQTRAARRAPAWRWTAVAAAIVASVLVLGSIPGTERSASAPVVSSAPSNIVAPAVQQLDLELSLAYARQADEREIAALWETRARLLAHASETGSVLLARL